MAHFACMRLPYRWSANEKDVMERAEYMLEEMNMADKRHMNCCLSVAR